MKNVAFSTAATVVLSFVQTGSVTNILMSENSRYINSEKKLPCFLYLVRYVF